MQQMPAVCPLSPFKLGEMIVVLIAREGSIVGAYVASPYCTVPNPRAMRSASARNKQATGLLICLVMMLMTPFNASRPRRPAGPSDTSIRSMSSMRYVLVSHHTAEKGCTRTRPSRSTNKLLAN